MNRSHSGIAACFRLLTGRQRRDYGIVVVLATFSALMEMISIISIIPVVLILVDYANAMQQAHVQWVFSVLGEPSRPVFLVALTLGAVALVWSSAVASLLSVFARQRFLKGINADLSSRVYRLYLAQPIEEFYGRASSEFMRNVNGISERVSMGVIGESIVLVARATQVLLIIGVLIAVNYVVALILVLVIFGSYTGIFLGIRRSLTRMTLESFAEARTLQQLTIGSYQAYRSIMIDQQLDNFVSHFQGLKRSTSRRAANIEFMAATPRQIIEVIGITLLLVAAFSIGRTSQNSHAMISLIALLGIAAYRILPAAQQLFHAVSRMTAALAVFGKVANQWVDLPVLRPRPPASTQSRVRPRKLEARQVSYSFGSTPVLRELSANFELAGIIRICGPSGAGKSTFLELLTGLRQPLGGEVLLDGVPLPDIDLKAWWSHLSYLSQGDYLFEGSLRKNIVLNDARVDDARLSLVAEICGLSSLAPGGAFQSNLSIAEGGVNLSGGQKNRVLLARALYKPSNIIMLDEAFSALDVDAARAILNSVRAKFPSRCIIIISHRDAELPSDVTNISLPGVEDLSRLTPVAIPGAA